MTLDKPKKDFMIIFIGKIFQVIIMILSLKIMTALLSAKEIGSIYLFMTISTFFVLSLISPFGQYINRHTHVWTKNKNLLDNLFLYVMYLFSVSTFSVLIGLFIYSYGISDHIPRCLFLLLLFFATLFLTLNQTIIPLLNMLHYRLDFTMLTLLTSAGVVLFGYILLTLFSYTAGYWLLGIVVSNALFTMIGFIILKEHLNETFHGILVNTKKINILNMKSILKFVIPLSVATLFMWLQNSGYRIVIEQKIGLEFLGFLGIGLAVSAQISGVFESIVMQYFHPIYYEKISHTDLDGRTLAINELINKVLPIYFMLALFLTFLAKYIVEILVDEKYYGVYIFTMFGVWIEFFRMVTNLLGNISQSEMNTQKFMIPYVLGSIVTISLVYFSSMISAYTLYLPIALILGSLVTLILMYISMKKLINFKINYKVLLIAFMLSTPYALVVIFNIDTSIYLSLMIVSLFGLYFLYTISFIYKRGLAYDYH